MPCCKLKIGDVRRAANRVDQPAGQTGRGAQVGRIEHPPSLGGDWKTHVREGGGACAAHEILSHGGVFLGAIDFVFGLEGDFWDGVNFGAEGMLFTR